MSKSMLAACGLVLALAVPVAQAQVTIDISKITCDQFMGYKIMGLRGIEWVIFGLKTRETWGLQGESAF
jgi:hypothetical protein